jgi:hypothetical protein
MTNPKAAHHPGGKKKQRKKGKGDKKPIDNLGGDNTKKKKSKYPCNICKEEHPTHQFPQFAEAQKLLAQQQPSMLMNLFPHGKNITQASTSTEGGNQGSPPSSSNPSSTNMYMMKGDAYISTRAHDYRKPSTFEKGKEYENPPLPLQIEKTLGETMTHIPKCAFNKSSHNPNTWAT